MPKPGEDIKAPVRRSTEWYCVQCSFVLGNVLGGELYPSVDGKQLRTSGPNLVVTCPECGASKVFYSADPVVRAVYQLVDAIATVSARSMVKSMGQAVHQKVQSDKTGQ